MSRKAICLVVAMMMLLAMLAGCNASVSPSASTTSAAKTETPDATGTPEATAGPNDEAFTIKVSSWDIIDEAEEIAYKANTLYKQEVEKEFKEIYPNATIQWNNTGNEKYFDLLKAQLASNTADDIFFHQNDLVAFAKAGYMADLTDQPFAASLLESTKPGLTYGGKLYAVAPSIAGWACWYNAKMFADNGWTMPKTWNDFIALCDAIKAKGMTPLVGGFKDSWTIGGLILADAVDIMGANPGFETDLYNGKAKLNGPEYQKVMGKLETLIQNGYYNKDCLSINWDQSRAYFEQGKAAMIIQGSWLPGSVASEVPDFQTGFMPIPDDNGNFFMSYGLNLLISVNANSKIPDKANALMGVLIGKKPLEIRYKDSSFSAIKGTEVEYTLPAIKDYAAALQSLPSGLQPSTYFPPSVWPVLTNIQSAIIAGQKFDPASLDEAQSTYEKDKSLVEIPQ